MNSERESDVEIELLNDFDIYQFTYITLIYLIGVALPLPPHTTAMNGQRASLAHSRFHLHIPYCCSLCAQSARLLYASSLHCGAARSSFHTNIYRVSVCVD